MSYPDGHSASITPFPIATAGEVFADGSMIELIGGAHPAHPQLMLWDGSKEIIAPAIEHNGWAYKPAPIENSILLQLMLPTRRCPHGTTRICLPRSSNRALQCNH